MYHGNGEFAQLWIDQSAGPDPGLDRLEWEPVVDAAEQLRISEPSKAPGQRIVAFEQLGTFVKIRSDMDRARLIDLARSFIVAPGNPAN